MPVQDKTSIRKPFGHAPIGRRKSLQNEFHTIKSDFDRVLRRLLVPEEMPDMESEFEKILSFVELLRNKSEKMLAINRELASELALARERIKELESERMNHARQLDERSNALEKLKNELIDVTQKKSIDDDDERIAPPMAPDFQVVAQEFSQLFEAIQEQLNHRDMEIFKARKAIDELVAQIVELFHSACRTPNE